MKDVNNNVELIQKEIEKREDLFAKHIYRYGDGTKTYNRNKDNNTDENEQALLAGDKDKTNLDASMPSFIGPWNAADTDHNTQD
mmetsp:Transcript_5000/g.5695  ORF Transcript_5000/g.5695 Transcript_5000/m.5695 type:complete len:84 (+) Transcript_5000:325-576(+)